MKKVYIFMCVLFLVGCKENATLQEAQVKETPITTISSSQSEMSDNKSFAQTFVEAGYLNVIARCYGNYDWLSFYRGDFNYVDSDYDLSLVNDNNTIRIDYNRGGKLDIHYYQYAINYVKENDLKSVTYELNMSFVEHMLDSINGNIELNDGSKVSYPFTFDYNNQLLLDNESNSTTNGKPIRFIDNLNEKLVYQTSSCYHASTLVNEVMRDFEEQYDNFVTNNIPFIEEESYSSDFLSNMEPFVYEHKLREVNFADSAYLYQTFNVNHDAKLIDELNSKERTLLFASLINHEISNINDIDWNHDLIALLTASSNQLGCDVRRCFNHDTFICLDYSNYEGYHRVSLVSDVSKLMEQLGVESPKVWIDSTNSLSNGVFADSYNQLFVTVAPEGDFFYMPFGIVIVNEEQTNGLEKIVFIKYQLEIDSTDSSVAYISDDLQFSIDNNIGKLNEQTIQFVYNHLDQLSQWQLTIDCSDSKDVCRVVSLKEYS